MARFWRWLQNHDVSRRLRFRFLIVSNLRETSVTSAVNQFAEQQHDSAARWRAGFEVLLIFVVFAVYAGWPVPDPNEPHYLGKARHYWDPAWIQNDFFLQSADSHWAFYVTCGWASRFLAFPALAWVGRVATWALLAIAWRRLSWSVIPQIGMSILSAALFVTLNENFQMAGEWVVGGFEAKGLAYALVFAGLAELVRGRWNATWILLGAASAFHVLVGGWTVLAAGICWLVAGPQRPRLVAMLPGLAVGGVLSLAGLVPALAINLHADPATVARANEIYVYERLTHHLSFFDIAAGFRWRFALLTIAWFVLSSLRSAGLTQNGLRAIVNASLGVVVVGIGLSIMGHTYPDRVSGLLRFYWFRLADCLVPLGVALGITALLMHWSESRWWARIATSLALAGLLLAPQFVARLSPGTPRADKPGKVTNYPDWRDACEWIAANTPPEARFLTPRTAQTFKWYAGRSEVATWKDLPQDAESIVAWRQRLEDLHGTGDSAEPWYDSLAEAPPSRLRDVAQRYDAQYLLTESEPPLDLKCIYQNDSYAVYEIASSDK